MANKHAAHIAVAIAAAGSVTRLARNFVRKRLSGPIWR
jgi:hypothetical protein